MEELNDKFGLILKVWYQGKQVEINREYWDGLPEYKINFSSRHEINMCWSLNGLGSIVLTSRGSFKSAEMSDAIIRKTVSDYKFYPMQYGLDAISEKKRLHYKPYCDCLVCFQPLQGLRLHPVWMNVSNLIEATHQKRDKTSSEMMLLCFASGEQVLLNFSKRRFWHFIEFDARLFVSRCQANDTEKRCGDGKNNLPTLNDIPAFLLKAVGNNKLNAFQIDWDFLKYRGSCMWHDKCDRHKHAVGAK